MREQSRLRAGVTKSQDGHPILTTMQDHRKEKEHRPVMMGCDDVETAGGGVEDWSHIVECWLETGSEGGGAEANCLPLPPFFADLYID